MNSILSILNRLESDSSRLAKEAILKREVNNSTLIVVFQLALDPYLNFFIKQVRPLMDSAPIRSMELNEALSQLRDGLSTRKYTGNAAKEFVANIFSKLSVDDQEVAARVIERDLRCGVNIATFNKCFPKNKLQPFQVMLCDRDISGIEYPCFSQCKADGTRAVGMLHNSEFTLLSRNGKPIEHYGKLTASAALILGEDEELDGELICIRNGKVLDRKTGNGIISKAIRGTISLKEADLLHFVVWDQPDRSGKIWYKSRIESLTKRIADRNPPKISIIESVVVNNPAEADAFYSKMRAAGEEGAVLKNFKNLWQGKRVSSQYKMKDELVCELRAVGWNYGTGRNADRVGSVIFQSEDGLLEVNVSGFEDEERDEMTLNGVEGRIASIMYNTVIQSKATGSKATLFLPRFNRSVGWRLDKSTANTLPEIQRGV